MPEKVNPWLEKKLKEVELGPELLSLIVQVDVTKKEHVKAELRKIADVTIVTEAFDYINIKAPSEAIPAIEKIDGVLKIHYDMPKKGFVVPSELAKVLSQIPFFAPFVDPLLGQVRIDPVVMPYLSPDLALPFNPMKVATVVNYKYIPVSATKKELLNIEEHGLTGKGVKVAVLDTGIFNPHPQIRMKAKELGTQMFPFPVDDNGHGHWCASTVVGEPWAGIFGIADGIAPLAELLSIKVLGYGIGAGTAMSVIEGMEKAYKNGAKIVSMSLGSEECQGGCGEEDGGPCPECRTVKMLTDAGIIFSIAAGNSGPDDMTLGCPACSPSSIAVAAHSLTDGKLSWFSSRGPQNKANAKMRITDLTMKPDVASYGGGRADKDAKPDEVLYNGCVGLLDGMYSGIKHFAEGLKGTSMATPHFTGLLALALEKGIVKNTADVKAILASKGHAKTKEEGYGLAKLSWFY